MQQQSDLICCVCGGRATGIHYEVVSCEACKSFFRRSVVLEARYSCRRHGDCVINLNTRISCKLCRLNKCVSAGMKREAVQLENTLSAKRLRANTPKPLISYDEIVISDSMVPNLSWVSNGTSVEHCGSRGHCSSSEACEMKYSEQSVTPLRLPSQQESSLPLSADASLPPPPLQMQLLQLASFQTSQLSQSQTLSQSDFTCFSCSSPTLSRESSSDETHVSMNETVTPPSSDCPTPPNRMHSRESCSSKTCTLCATIDEVFLEEDREKVAATIASPKMLSKPISSELSRVLKSPDRPLGSSKLSSGACGNVEGLLSQTSVVSQHISKAFGVHEEIEELDGFLKCMHKWAVSVPSFKSLLPKYQEKLLQSCWCEICVLKIAIMQIAHDSTFVFSNGCFCTMEQLEDQKYHQILCDIKHHVSSWLDHMNVDRTENGHLMTLLLLNPDAKGLDKETVKTLLEMQDKILQSLQSHIQKEHPSAPGRMSQLLVRLGSIKTLSVEFRQWVAEKQSQYDKKLNIVDSINAA